MGWFSGPNFDLLEKNKDVEKLIEYLQSNNKYGIRISACNSLGEIGDKRSISPLIDLLNEENMKFNKNSWLSDDKKAVRTAAIHALGEIYTREKDQRIIKPLVDELIFFDQTCYGGDSSEEAIKALININDNDVKKVLISKAYDSQYLKYMPLLKDFLKEASQNPELLPLINETRKKLSDRTREILRSDVLHKLLPNEKIFKFTIVSCKTGISSQVDGAIATVAATAVLGPLGGLIFGGGGGGYSSAIIGCNDKDFFFIEVGDFFSNKNGFLTFSKTIDYKSVLQRPFKSVKVDYNEKTGIFVMHEPFKRECIFGDFMNFNNLDDVPSIVRTLKNA